MSIINIISVERRCEIQMKKGAVNPMLIALIVVAVLVVGIGAVMMNKQNSQQISQAPAAQTQNMEEAAESTSAESKEQAEATDKMQTSPAVAGTESSAKSIDVEAGSFYYKPNEIRVKKGETVKITLHSVSMMHDFNIDELNVKSPIVKNGDTGTVEFVASKAGEFEYYCSVGQHRAQGQVGKLIVEE